VQAIVQLAGCYILPSLPGILILLWVEGGLEYSQNAVGVLLGDIEDYLAVALNDANGDVFVSGTCVRVVLSIGPMSGVSPDTVMCPVVVCQRTLNRSHEVR